MRVGITIVTVMYSDSIVQSIPYKDVGVSACGVPWDSTCESIFMWLNNIPTRVCVCPLTGASPTHVYVCPLTGASPLVNQLPYATMADAALK